MLKLWNDKDRQKYAPDGRLTAVWVADDWSPVHVGVGKVVLKQDVQRTHVVTGMCVTCIFKLKHVQTHGDQNV